MKLKRVHNVLAFDQKDWMKSYITLNTELRKQATSTFEKNFFKLMNNSVFGKTMENLRNQTVVKLRAGEEANLRKLLSSPFFASAAVFGESLAGIQIHKESILMNKPVYTGMCVLELSKLLMYKFYYQHLKYKYGARCELLYMDTDSLLLKIQTEDIYEDMGRHLELYDTSDYPEDHPLHSQENKKVIGKMKDECNGKPISEVVCLRSKMYSIKIEGGENKKKAKGTTKVVKKKEISHQNYKDSLFGRQSYKHGKDMFRSIDLPKKRKEVS